MFRSTEPANEAQSSLGPVFLSPRFGVDSAHSFEFMSYDAEDHMDEGGIISSSLSSSASRYSNKPGNEKCNGGDDVSSRHGHLPAPSSSVHDAPQEVANNSTQDHFRSVIQEQIPHLVVPVSQRKRSASVTSSTEGTTTETSSTLSPSDSSNNIVTAQPDDTSALASRLTKTQLTTGPKRPRTAYIIFLEHFRQIYYEKFPNASFNECQKIAGKKWRSLSEEEKQPWKVRERLSQKDFIHQMHGLQSSFGLVKKESSASVSSSALANVSSDYVVCSASQDVEEVKVIPHFPKNQNQHNHSSQLMKKCDVEVAPASVISQDVSRSEDQESPHQCETGMTNHHRQMRLILNANHPNKMSDLLKGPKNAFSIFVNSMRKECQENDPNLTYNEIQKKLSVQWRQMSNDEKHVWVQKSKEIKRQLQEYNTALEAQGLDHDSVKKGDMKRVKKGIILPKGPRSAYTLFYQCARKQLHEVRPQLSFKEYPTICSKIWRDMPADEKILWKNDAANDKIRYERELLALASSDVAHTATSIVMEEEKMNKMKMHMKSEEFENMLSAHTSASSSCGGGGGGSSSSRSSSSSGGDGGGGDCGGGGGGCADSSNCIGGGESTSRGTRGSNENAHSGVSNGSVMSSSCDEEEDAYVFSAYQARKRRRGWEDKERKQVKSATGSSSNTHLSHQASMTMSSSSGDSITNINKSLNSLGYTHHLSDCDNEAWMDVNFSHGSKSYDENNTVSKEHADALSRYSRDSMDHINSEHSPAMVGIAGRNLSYKSPRLSTGPRDFTAAGMTSKLEEEDDDDTPLAKNFSLSPHVSSDREDLGVRCGLYHGINQHSSDSHDMVDDSHALMNFSAFEDFR